MQYFFRSAAFFNLFDVFRQLFELLPLFQLGFGRGLSIKILKLPLQLVIAVEPFLLYLTSLYCLLHTTARFVLMCAITETAQLTKSRYRKMLLTRQSAAGPIAAAHAYQVYR